MARAAPNARPWQKCERECDICKAIHPDGDQWYCNCWAAFGVVADHPSVIRETPTIVGRGFKTLGERIRERGRAGVGGQRGLDGERIGEEAKEEEEEEE